VGRKNGAKKLMNKSEVKSKVMPLVVATLTATMFYAGFVQIAQALTLREQGIHNEHQVTCKDCHLIEKPTSGKPQSKACLDCHGPYEKVAKRTQKLPVNPHASHMGPVECLKCHSIHDLPDEFDGPCVECHTDFEFKVK
jgi:fumarate reductase flavoprotein subunit